MGKGDFQVGVFREKQANQMTNILAACLPIVAVRWRETLIP